MGDNDAPSMTNGEGTIIRRIVPSDNSCLFTSIAYVFESTTNPTPPGELRKIISQQLLDRKDEFNEVILEEDPVSYAAWFVFIEY